MTVVLKSNHKKILSANSTKNQQEKQNPKSYWQEVANNVAYGTLCIGYVFSLLTVIGLITLAYSNYNTALEFDEKSDPPRWSTKKIQFYSKDLSGSLLSLSVLLVASWIDISTSKNLKKATTSASNDKDIRENVKMLKTWRNIHAISQFFLALTLGIIATVFEYPYWPVYLLIVERVLLLFPVIVFLGEMKAVEAKLGIMREKETTDLV